MVCSLISLAGDSWAARLESILYTVEDWLVRKTCAFLSSGTEWTLTSVLNLDQ